MGFNRPLRYGVTLVACLASLLASGGFPRAGEILPPSSPLDLWSQASVESQIDAQDAAPPGPDGVQRDVSSAELGTLEALAAAIRSKRKQPLATARCEARQAAQCQTASVPVAPTLNAGPPHWVSASYRILSHEPQAFDSALPLAADPSPPPLPQSTGHDRTPRTSEWAPRATAVFRSLRFPANPLRPPEDATGSVPDAARPANPLRPGANMPGSQDY